VIHMFYWYATISLCACVGVVFNNLDVNGTNPQYTIRPVHEVEGENDRSTWDTNVAQPRFQEPGPRFSPKSVGLTICLVCIVSLCSVLWSAQVHAICIIFTRICVIVFT